jgi:hypothetical protein
MKFLKETLIKDIVEIQMEVAHAQRALGLG